MVTVGRTALWISVGPPIMTHGGLTEQVRREKRVKSTPDQPKSGQWHW